jgi:hypothetical protein
MQKTRFLLYTVTVCIPADANNTNIEICITRWFRNPPPFRWRKTNKCVKAARIHTLQTCEFFLACHIVCAWGSSLQRVHRVAMATFWRTFHLDGKISPAWCGWRFHALVIVQGEGPNSSQYRRSNGSLHRVFACGAGGPGFDSRLRRFGLGCSMQRM